MEFVLINGRVLTDRGLEDGLAVRVQGGRIAAVGPQAEVGAGAPARDLAGGLLLPGFIDTQVNGGGGVLFNEQPTPEGIARIGAAHRRFGTTGFLPTLISDDLSTVEQAIGATRQALAARAPGVLGLHIEGPFLNARRKGIHDASKFRSLDDAAFALLTSLGAGRTLVTLAPEASPVEMIQRLAAAGVVVAAGHTNATYATMRNALAHGLTGFTHLFNAMSPLTSREPGAVGAALESQEAWAGVVVDGKHVDPVVLRLALRCRPVAKFMLVTDAMPCVGSDQASFMLQGKHISVRNGACYDDHGTLAGSNLDMASAVRNAVRMLGLDLPTAVRMASQSPAEFLGLGGELGRIATGYRADLVLADDDLNVIDTWIDGLDTGAAAHG
ncbi:N-acetylglucosamine-6-phosphate deacetylase [Phenylobacterium montanum]|uniref:N-acetylglucosamine-6-phosphate deacetylase n=1 Tax=Phenylobacterium montanum TaxID=2823693 RepID=A0A975G104_9CAUL|nr:N-acetylglucosamine-6-phosphate deacetylase [Caulobacter sp. S6]QUD88567.1 N-acetylglucosamine-6-phosphate deacetylase [Caulobacter sp. S6]